MVSGLALPNLQRQAGVCGRQSLMWKADCILLIYRTGNGPYVRLSLVCVDRPTDCMTSRVFLVFLDMNYQPVHITPNSVEPIGFSICNVYNVRIM